MRKDPIVEEVRRAGEELAREANYDPHAFFLNLRRHEAARKARSLGKPVKKARAR